MLRRPLSAALLLATTVLAVHALPRGARAFEFFDGRLQIHGFYEAQVRAIARDLDASDDWDLTQLAHILNLELEADIAPDGWGPFDFVSGFARIEVRYDCVWTRACGLFPSADAYGDRVGTLPKRLFDGRRPGLVGTVPDFVRPDDRGYDGESPYLFGIRGVRGVAVDEAPGVPGQNGRVFDKGFAASDVPPFAVPKAGETEYPAGTVVDGERRAFGLESLPAVYELFKTPGYDTRPGTADDPGPFVFSRYVSGSRCRFSTRREPGPEGGIANFLMGPHDPGCFVDPIAALTDKPNPFRGQFAFFDRLDPMLDMNDFRRDPALPAAQQGDLNPILLASPDVTRGSGNIRGGDLPFRPAPTLRFDASAPSHEPKGLWVPNAEVARLLREDKLDRFGGNFRQAELEWNRGASQQDEKELKEAYLDFELFESRLWLRLGKQSIVWGKTELFRNQDQFNPQDFALSSLPSLEESRISLWALRGVYSLYNVGPLEDVRVEFAVNYDQFEGADLGRCGEPYAVSLVCSGYFGFLAHGVFGAGLAGVRSPENPWDSWKGIEAGVRVEWRWDRFSFALTDFYGYQDLPYIERIFTYERNVDPETGRPRHTNSRGSCTTGNEPSCLQPFVPDPDDPRLESFAGRAALQPANALDFHSANQTVFAVSCAAGIYNTDGSPREACGNAVFNSHKNFNSAGGGQDIPPNFTVFASLIGALHAGSASAWSFATAGQGALKPPNFYPFVPLRSDVCDGPLPPPGCTLPDAGEESVNDLIYDPGGGLLPSLNSVLTQEQRALLGCGAFYSSNCEADGMDLLNMEASVFVQSFPGIEGTTGDWSMLDAVDAEGNPLPQPGTLDFDGGPVATRFERGRLRMLPGSRGSFDLPDSPYDVLVDGSTGTLADPCAVIVNAGGSLCHPLAGFVGDTDAILFNGNELYDCDGPGPMPAGPQRCQLFRSEMAALSYNAMVVLSGLSLAPLDSDFIGFPTPRQPLLPIEVDEFDSSQPFRLDGCSFAKPQYCKNFASFMLSLSVERNTVRAGGNGKYGRRDFQWHSGSPVVIRYEKTNVLGFSMDWAEDFTKSNWSMELTWVEDLPYADADEIDGLRDVNTWNLTLSVDRPTFINFLNANRTFFFNSQLFVQYVDGYRSSFPSSGPWNFLGTVAVTTGYFQDRLLPTAIFVYDKRSNSGAFLPQLTYRFTENFSATFGMALFAGRVERKDMAITPIATGNRVGEHAYSDFVVNGLSAVRERDEAYLRIKYTF